MKKKEQLTGTLYGIGVGPGDPELLTLKAVRIMKECHIIAIPGKEKEQITAYKIARLAVPEIAEKECLTIEMPMTKDEEILQRSHEEGGRTLCHHLSKGRDIAFLTLGDPCIYSTYLYLHKLVNREGFLTEIINGIPSFCAVSAKLSIGLAEKDQMLHILPASYHIKEGLSLSGTKVLMKAGKNMDVIKQQLQTGDHEVHMVENCGMDQEKVYHRAENIPTKASYYSLIVVKEQMGKEE